MQRSQAHAGAGRQARSLRTIALLICAATCRAQSRPCQPAAEITVELQRAAAIPIADVFAAEQNIAPFLAIRERHPDDLFAHEFYQDAVQRFGIEGHLRQLTADYRELDLRHPGNVTYHYLFLRTQAGRGTSSAIRELAELVREAPDFAPAHRTLAEIHGAAGLFQDRGKESAEREKFLALCPDAALHQRATQPPDPSPLLDQAERLLAADSDPSRIIAMTGQALREDEWRQNRIRAFDWYSDDYKRQIHSDLIARYWRAWTIQVRCYRKAGRPEEAAELLALMARRATPLYKLPGQASWNALEALVMLYAEGKQRVQAIQRLDQMESFVKEHPDPERSETLRRLHALLSLP